MKALERERANEANRERMKALERERANEANIERAFENPCRGSETRFHSFWSTPSRASWPRAASARIPVLGVRV